MNNNQDENLPPLFKCYSSDMTLSGSGCPSWAIGHSCFIHCSCPAPYQHFKYLQQLQVFPENFPLSPWKAFFSSFFPHNFMFVKVCESHGFCDDWRRISYFHFYRWIIEQADRKVQTTQIFSLTKNSKMKTCVVTTEVAQWQPASTQKSSLILSSHHHAWTPDAAALLTFVRMSWLFFRVLLLLYVGVCIPKQ